MNKLIKTEFLKDVKKSDIIEEMRGCVYQYKRAAKSLLSRRFYIRSRTCNVRPNDGGGRGNCDVYYIDEFNSVSCLCYDTTKCRAMTLIRALKSGKIHEIDPNIVNNYKTNGYNTRRGLYANYSSKIDRIKKIAHSHSDYLGCETGNSSFDHKQRVQMRNGL